MTIQIVDFPIKNGGSFHSYVKLPEGSHFKPFASFPPGFLDFPMAPALEVSYAEVKATTLAVMAKDIALGRRQELSMWSQDGLGRDDHPDCPELVYRSLFH